VDLTAPSRTLDPARSVDPARYAIGGVAPHEALRPVSRDEVAEVLRAAARDHQAVAPWGGGTALSRDAAPDRYDVALDLTALDRVVEYEPEDLTLTAECGVTLAHLRALVAARGQELPLEAPHADRATLGGVLAANASGPRRLRFGAPRDRILGSRFALGDGTLARTGGKVVKNVAGYGIHRMLCGSRGGLGVILEASLKLAPAPERRVALVFGADAGALADAARWAALPRLEPALVTVVGRDMASALPQTGQPFAVVVGLEDDTAWVERQIAIVESALGAPAARVEDEPAIALWQSLADLEDAAEGRLTFTTAANTPAALATLLDQPAAASLVFHAPAGRLHLFPPAAQAADLGRRLSGAGFTLIDAGLRTDVDPTLPPESSILALRARLRAQLDPASVMALGERWERGR
jgi:glycolate oxidase FAD binding subunit